MPFWHHKLLFAWCAQQVAPVERPAVTPADICASYPEVSAGAKLAERCGTELSDVLTFTVPYTELLFPEGSMASLLPVYEDSVAAKFYNQCIVAVLKSVITHMPNAQRAVAVEVGAGTGGTASSILPVVAGMCERYVFTDVSDVFLRNARSRFASLNFASLSTCCSTSTLTRGRRALPHTNLTS